MKRRVLSLLSSNTLKFVQRRYAHRPCGPGGLFDAENSNRPSARAKEVNITRLSASRRIMQEKKLSMPLKNKPDFETDEERIGLVEKRIRDAMLDGDFENLRDKGKPLPPNNERTVRDTCLRILKEQEFRPPWLDLMHRIDRSKLLLRKFLHHAWRSGSNWQLALQQAESYVVEINKDVDHFNISRPHSMRHLFRLRVRMPEEIEKAASDEHSDHVQRQSLPKKL